MLVLDDELLVAESVTELHAPSTALAQAGFSTWHPLHMEHYDDPILAPNAPVDDPEHVHRLRFAGLAGVVQSPAAIVTVQEDLHCR